MLTAEGKSLWGVAHRSVSKPTGVLVDFNSTKETSLYAETNLTGGVCGQYEYDEKTSISYTVVAMADANELSKGETVEVDGVSYYVTSSSVVESNQSFKKISVNAERYRKCEKVVPLSDGEDSGKK